MPSSIIRRSLLGVSAVAVFTFLVWASDAITLQGERTIYTVNCEGGLWNDLHCTGKMEAGARYRYRASKSRNEVVFWVAGSSTPSGKYSDCKVRNRGNWSCKPTAEGALSITFEMTDERATHEPSTLAVPFHAVPKWKWWLLRAGYRSFHQAAY